MVMSELKGDWFVQVDLPPVQSNKVYLYDIPDKDTKPETGFEARGNQELLQKFLRLTALTH